jgi:predicted flavoprotein YhiN
VIDLANVRPLHAILGPDWKAQDMMLLFEPEVRAQLLIEETRAQRKTLTMALNSVAHAMMPRHKVRGAYRLGEMRHFYQKRQVACVGEAHRAQLDALFAEPEVQVASTPTYQYPLVTHCGIAWREPVTDHNPSVYCRHCPYLEACGELVTQRDGYALCEIVLEDDLIPEAVLYG